MKGMMLMLLRALVGRTLTREELKQRNEDAHRLALNELLLPEIEKRVERLEAERRIVTRDQGNPG